MTPETPAQTIARLKKHVANLSAGRQVMCGFCGHVYGDKFPANMADALKQHIASCPEHPMHQVLAVLKSGRDLVAKAEYSQPRSLPDHAVTRTWLNQAEAAIAKAEFVQPKKAARKKK
jgi:hypothetical protein